MADQHEQGIRPAVGSPAPTTQIQGQPPAREAGAIALPAVSAPSVPVAAAEPPASLGRLDMLLAVLLAGLTFLLGSFAATNSDVWMNLASGQRIANGEWAIGVDPFSFATEATTSRPAVPWVEHSWLYSLLLYVLYNLMGGAGLVILKALAVTALAVCLLSIPGGRKARFRSVIYVGLAMVAISSQLILRPMTVSFLFFGVTLLICYRAGALGYAAAKPRLLWRLPVLFWLWANLDVWFIMGPLTLAFLWAGTGVGALLGKPSQVAGTTLGAVLGVGLLACVLNPHHVHVFMLPPELASLVAVVDLPDFLGAGGRALRNLHWADPDYYSLASPLSSRHWRGAPVSQTVAGLALLALSLFSFAVGAVAPKRPGAPSIHPGRLLLWSVLALLSLIQARLIPWFAIASAPITVLNLVEWPARRANIQVPNWRPALLSRGLALLVAAVLLFLAWPGWLSTHPGDMQSPRRVAWKVPVDPSLQGAAQELAELNKGGQGIRVFNFSADLANYCAYFAPGVKCYVDTRWSLFPDELAKAAKARMALAVNVPEGWHKTFADAKVNYLAISTFQNRRETEAAGNLWRNEVHWLQKYTDGKALIFAWSGPDKTFAGEFHASLNRRAFGKVPTGQRAPANLPTASLEEPTFWSQYWQEGQPSPLGASEALLYLQYFHVMAVAWQEPYAIAAQLTRGLATAGFAPLGASAAYTCANVGVNPSAYAYQNNNPVLKGSDLGPPAAPLLALRAVRRAVADNPRYPRNYLILSDLCGTLNRQEDYWANYRGEPGRTGPLRAAMRQLQILTALTTYLDLRPDDAAVQERVGSMLVQLKHFDAALAHFQQALLHWDDYAPAGSDGLQLAAFKSKKEALEKRVRDGEQGVQKRLDSYGLSAASKKGLDKVLVAMGHKLPQKAVEVLAELKVETLTKEEQAAREFLRVQLLVQLGRAGFLTEPITHPNLAELRLRRAAAVGDYADLDKAFDAMERIYAANRAGKTRGANFLHALVVTRPAPIFTGALAHATQTLASQLRCQDFLTSLMAPEAELLTLRGSMALEYGDTAAARRHLEKALRLAGPELAFPDRPIAERYLQLLREQEK